MLKIAELLNAGHLKKINFEKLKQATAKGVSIDSRIVKKGEIFFAIKGERTDGHNYLRDAFRRGALLAVVNENWYKRNKKHYPNNTFLIVRDTILTLGEFARIHKRNLEIRTLCIGGSNGKTSTKDLTAAVLSGKFRVLKTEGNLNNHIGLPLTLLRLKASHEICVLEAGSNHFGEIKYLCSIAEPEYGLITNIGKEHLEFFKNTDGVARAEFELYDYLKEKEGVKIFFNLDDKYIKKYSKRVSNEKKFSYSYKFNADVEGRFEGYDKRYHPEIKIRFGKKEFKARISTFGKHSIYNGLAAVAVGLYFGVSPRNIKSALANFKQDSSKRMEILKQNGMTIINDTYNSNPESVKMGLEAMLGFRTKGKKYAVISDMLELGKSAGDEHSAIGRFAVKSGIENLFTYGKESYNIFLSAKKVKNNFYFDDKKELIEMLRRNLKKDDVIYVKGSRGMKMEEVVSGIIKS